MSRKITSYQMRVNHRLQRERSFLPYIEFRRSRNYQSFMRDEFLQRIIWRAWLRYDTRNRRRRINNLLRGKDPES